MKTPLRSIMALFGVSLTVVVDLAGVFLAVTVVDLASVLTAVFEEVLVLAAVFEVELVFAVEVALALAISASAY